MDEAQQIYAHGAQLRRGKIALFAGKILELGCDLNRKSGKPLRNKRRSSKVCTIDL